MDGIDRNRSVVGILKELTRLAETYSSGGEPA